MNKSYKEALLDPRWQKKKLEILSRDNFSCVVCGDSDKTLHVHHSYYEKSREPWEYENHSLRTMCHDCHEEEPTRMYVAIARLISAMKKVGFTSTEVFEFAMAFNGLSIDNVEYVPLLIKNFLSDNGKVQSEIEKVLQDE